MGFNLKADSIQFPATQVPSADPNTNDDYREGTFVTSLVLGSGSAPLNASFNTLGYTKNGRMVHVYGTVQLGTVSSPSGALTMLLPFTAGAGSQLSNRAAASVMVNSMAAGWTGVPVGYVSETTAMLSIFEFAAGVAGNPGAKLATGGFITISLTYAV